MITKSRKVKNKLDAQVDMSEQHSQRPVDQGEG